MIIFASRSTIKSVVPSTVKVFSGGINAEKFQLCKIKQSKIYKSNAIDLSRKSSTSEVARLYSQHRSTVGGLLAMYSVY